MTTRLENKTGASNKFWEISLSGSSTTVRYGKIGAKGTTQTKNHGTELKAKKFVETQIAKKEKGGYVLIEDKKRSRESESLNENEEKAEKIESKAATDSKPSQVVVKKSKASSDIARAPVKWFLSCGDETSSSYGIYVNEEFVYAGNEQGDVIKADHQGNVIAKFKFPSGVKAIVGDGQFLYVGTTDGLLFDLSNESAPRELCDIQGFKTFLWIDVCDGMIACSDGDGRVAVLNGEGERQWNTWFKPRGSGWCVRMDESGVYYGHAQGVVKYNFNAKTVWSNDTVVSVLFGVQTAEHLFVTGCGRDDFIAGSCQIDKATGETVRVFQASGSSCAVNQLGTLFVVQRQAFDVNSGEQVWKFEPDYTRDTTRLNNALNAPSMAIHDSKLFTVGAQKDYLALVDISTDVITKALAGKVYETKKLEIPESIQVIQIATDVDVVDDDKNGVVVKCVKKDGALRMRVISAGYNKNWNVQFPKKLRRNGAKFIVDSVVESKNGGFYRAVGDIKQLKK